MKTKFFKSCTTERTEHKDSSPILLFFTISQRTGLKVIQNVLCMCVYVYKYIFGLSIFINVLKLNVQLDKKESVQGASTTEKI